VLSGQPWKTLGRCLRAIRLDAAGSEAAVGAAFRRAEEELARGEAVCVFTEPGSADAALAAAHRSALERLAGKGSAPVVAVAVRGPGAEAEGPGDRRVLLTFERAGTRPLAVPGVATALDAARGGH
jgi:hypothetical protein